MFTTHTVPISRCADCLNRRPNMELFLILVFPIVVLIELLKHK